MKNILKKNDAPLIQIFQKIKMQPKKKLLIFDIDGTLLYSNKIDSQCFADTFVKIYKKPFPSIDWTTFPHVTDDTIFKTAIKRQLQKEATAEEMQQFKRDFTNLLHEQRVKKPADFKEIPFAKKTIDNLLADDQFAVGIGTGGWYEPAKIKLNHVGIPHDQLVIEAADGNETRENILQSVLQKARQRFTFEDVVYIGDAIWDVETTRNLNMKFVGIRRSGDHDFLKNLGATQVLTDYSNYKNFLFAIENATPPKFL